MATQSHSVTYSPALFRRKLNKTLPMALSGQGVWLFDQSGQPYLDASAGCGAVNIGHGVEAVAQAMAKQAQTLAYVNGTQWTNPVAEALADALANQVERTILDPKFYFMTSGSEAVEAALKFARQHWVDRGKPQKKLFVSRKPSYHGATIGSLSVSGRPLYKEPFRPMLMESPQIPAPWGDERDAKALQALEEIILEFGHEHIAAFIAEPIGGSSTGGAVPSSDYWSQVRKICDRYDILLIADEVLCGMGRTGKWLACEHFGLHPDILVLGKGLSGGYVPLSALVVSGALLEEMIASRGQFLHAGTFSHTPLICQAGLSTVQYLEKYQLVEQSALMGLSLHHQLKSLLSHPSVAAVRGLGLLAGIEFMADKQAGKPFSRQQQWTERLVETAFDHGLVVWPNVGHLNQNEGDMIILTPPFVITEEEIEQLVSLLDKVITTVEQSL